MAREPIGYVRRIRPDGYIEVVMGRRAPWWLRALRYGRHLAAVVALVVGCLAVAWAVVRAMEAIQ